MKNRPTVTMQTTRYISSKVVASPQCTRYKDMKNILVCVPLIIVSTCYSYHIVIFLSKILKNVYETTDRRKLDSKHPTGRLEISFKDRDKEYTMFF